MHRFVQFNYYQSDCISFIVFSPYNMILLIFVAMSPAAMKCLLYSSDCFQAFDVSITVGQTTERKALKK